MAMEFGVLVDYQGYFLAALQWEASEGAPEFNKPRKDGSEIPPEQRVTLLRDDAALLVDDPKSKWNGTGWDLPTERYWVVDQKGTRIGGRTYWPDRPPTAKPGTEIVYIAPPVESHARAKSIWDSENSVWKVNRRVALIDDDGLINNIVLENPRTDTEDVIVPGDWEREDDDGGFPVDVDGGVISIGTIKDENGVFSFCNFTITKQRLTTVLTNQNLTNEWQTHLEAEGLWDNWLNLADSFPIPLAAKDKLIIKFAKAQGYTRSQIVNFIRNQLRE